MNLVLFLLSLPSLRLSLIASFLIFLLAFFGVDYGVVVVA